MRGTILQMPHSMLRMCPIAGRGGAMILCVERSEEGCLDGLVEV